MVVVVVKVVVDIVLVVEVVVLVDVVVVVKQYHTYADVVLQHVVIHANIVVVLVRLWRRGNQAGVARGGSWSCHCSGSRRCTSASSSSPCAYVVSSLTCVSHSLGCYLEDN
eukprot:14607878-Heterocapsa_arctica.AAC.1